MTPPSAAHSALDDNPSSSGDQTVYYALGGGLGHLTRTVSLARQLAAKWTGRHRVLANTEFRQAATALVATEPRLELTLVPRERDTPAARRWVVEWLNEVRPTYLSVDTFPRGIGGELANWLGQADCPTPRSQRWLVSRPLPTTYVESFEVRDFVVEHFARVVTPGETSLLANLVETLETSPFLLRNHDELPSLEQAARGLGVSPESGAALLVASGTHDEVRRWSAWYDELARRWPCDLPPLRFVCPRDITLTGYDEAARGIVSPVPLIDCLPAVRLVLGAAGYNLSHETRTLGIPAIQHGRPLVRPSIAPRSKPAAARRPTGCHRIVAPPRTSSRAAHRSLRQRRQASRRLAAFVALVGRNERSAVPAIAAQSVGA